MSKREMLWNGPFRYPEMVYLEVPMDGSCLLHSLLLAYDQNYRLEKQNNHPISKKAIVKELRQELSLLLAAPIDPLDPDGLRYYDLIARGSLPEISISYPDYTLENMQKTLRDNKAYLDYIYFEFIGDALVKDIYILDGKNKDVYMTKEEDLYQKGRKSIVLFFEHNHYGLVGVKKESGTIRTLFSPKDDFIMAIRGRQEQLRK